MKAVFAVILAVLTASVQAQSSATSLTNPSGVGPVSSIASGSLSAASASGSAASSPTASAPSGASSGAASSGASGSSTGNFAVPTGIPSESVIMKIVLLGAAVHVAQAVF